jgi:hypothetical protein
MTVATAVLFVCDSAAQSVIYDSLWIVDDNFMDAGSGNAIAKTPGTSGRLTDSQIADDFFVKGTMQITTVIADLMAHDGNLPSEGIWVQLYADDDGAPSEKEFAQIVVLPDDYIATPIVTPLSFDSWRIEMDVSAANIVLEEGRWWVNTQPLDIATNFDWYWHIGSVSIPTIEQPSHVRDGGVAHGNGYAGLWNSSTWIPHNFRGNNSLSMRIEGEAVGGCEPCDVNCDGVVDAFDIDPFIGLLLGGGSACSPCAADANGDGVIDAFDIEPFVNCLTP